MRPEPADSAKCDAEPDPVCILLAGGRGSRLHELTDHQCKPAVAFGPHNRIVDFTLHNIHRSGLRQLLVATQYCADGLETYLDASWRPLFKAGLRLRRPPGFQGRSAEYGGTADAVWKNVAEIDALAPAEVLVLSADHIYAMDYRPMIAAHRASGAAVTIAADVVPVAQARAFGCILASADGRITDFVEKPRHPPTLPGRRGHSLVSMGIYVFNWAWLRARLAADAKVLASTHDFGNDILPGAVAEGVAHVHQSSGSDQRPFYWRDVGTLDAFRESWLQFCGPQPPCDLPMVPVSGLPLLAGHAGGPQAAAMTRSRIVAFPQPDARNRGPVLTDSILMPGARVADGCRLTRTILAPATRLPPGLVIGEDPEQDARWFRVTPGGTTLVTSDMLARRAALIQPRFLPATPLHCWRV